MIYESSSFSQSATGDVSSTIASAISSTLSITGSSVVPAMNTLVLQRKPTDAVSPGAAALGWTTTVAVSILVLQWIGNRDERARTTPLDWIARTISKLWNKKQSLPPETAGSSSEKEKEDSEKVTVVLHRGSCHCGSITFKLTPARKVVVKKSLNAGKLQYPTARVPADQLQLISGKHLWNSYHVRSETTGETWAYSFCNQCAVHLLHATDADQSSLFVNLQCFNGVKDGKAAEPNAPLGPFAMEGIDTSDNSVVSTVTANTQKSMMTVTTTLPTYANPRGYYPQQQSSLVSDGDSNSDSAVPAEPPSVNQMRRSLKVSASPKISSFGVVSYTPTADTDKTEPKTSPFAQPVAPTAQWPLQQSVEEEDDISISTHDSPNNNNDDGLGYYSEQGNTAASTTGNNSASSSIDYNVTVNRERMLQNMRKHLKQPSPQKEQPSPQED